MSKTRAMISQGRAPVIAIDGPAGAGKSTAARELARKLGYKYVDTGASYRAVALKAMVAGTCISDPVAIAELARETCIWFEWPEGQAEARLIMDGRDVTDQLRRPEVDRCVSAVAAIPEVRRQLVRLQRELARRGGVVMDGRDIGTRVLRDAEYKFFLTAAEEERARRRHLELLSRGYEMSQDEVLREMAARDKRDSEREDSPLEPAPDAEIIDTTRLSPAEVVDALLGYIRGG